MAGYYTVPRSIRDAQASSMRSRIDRYESLIGSRISYKFSRMHMMSLIQYCRVKVDIPSIKRVKRSRFYSLTRFPWWSDVALALYVISTLHVGLNLYHQYKLDFDLRNYESLVEEAYNKTGSAVTGDALLQLEERIHIQRHTLHQIGAPNVNLSFAIECIYMIILVFSSYAYFLSQFFPSGLADFDQHLIRCLLNYERELINCQGYINEQVYKFMSSSRIHSHLIIEQSRGDQSSLSYQEAQNENIFSFMGQGRDGVTWISPDDLRYIMDLKLHLEEKLTELAAGMGLLPVYSEPDWIASWVPIYYLAHACNLIYGILLDSFICYSLVCLPSFMSNPTFSLGDILIVCETYFLCATCNLASIFYGGICFCTHFEDDRLAYRVRDLIVDTTTRNRATLNVMVDHSEGVGASMDDFELTRRKMNTDILRALMHYKIYVSRHKRTKDTLSWVLASCIGVGFIAPVVSYLHMPHFSDEIAGDFNFLLLSASVLILAPTTLILFTACISNQSRLKMYKSLYGLLAHTIEVATLAYPVGSGVAARCKLAGGSRFEFFYDEHLVLLLRRELDGSPDISEEFSIALWTLRFNNKLLIQSHFYFVAILISVTFRMQ